MKILLLNGSLAEKSHTRELLLNLETILKERGVQTNVWDLKDHPLPFILPEYHKNPEQHPDQIVRDFVQKIDESQAIILGTPLYHGSYSGVLKNALDNLRADAFKNKWIGLVGNAGTVRADQVSFSHLRHVVNTLEGYTIQTHIGTNRADYNELEDRYILTEQSIKDRCVRFVDELLKVTRDN